jgi:hypothetical protein
VPFFHDKLVGNVELVKNKVEYIDIVPSRLPLNVDELERSEVPVANYNQRSFFCKAEVIGGMEER